MTGEGTERCPQNGSVVPAGGPFACRVPADEAGQRLDHFLARRFPDQSRSSFHKLISAANILVDGQPVKAGYRLRGDNQVTVAFPALSSSTLVGEQIDFPILFEDDHLLVINKPPGLVVHPAGGHHHGTLVHGLLYRCADLPAAEAGRPGIVHRLDKDTSGVMLVAKTEPALRALMADFKDRRIQKTYQALLLRCPRERDGRIVLPIGRHPVDRKKMAIRQAHGRYAATSWHVLETYTNGWCLAEIGIETGRTHQIRVHLAEIRSPVAGDQVYGGAVGRGSALQPLRQMLHAHTLCCRHPFSGQELSFTAPLWDDMQALLDRLRLEHR